LRQETLTKYVKLIQIELIEKYSYFGLLLILLIEEAGIPLPIPGDIFIASASALPKSNYFLIVASVVTATLIGSTILFTIAKKIGHPLLLKFGPKIRITKDKVKKVEAWFEKYGGFAIVIGRLIPGFRTITPFAAGLFGVSYKTFWLYTTVAAFIWANIYFILGRFFGSVLTTFLK